MNDFPSFGDGLNFNLIPVSKFSIRTLAVVTYDIIASFASDDSHASLAAATAVTIGPVPSEIVIPEQTVPTDYAMTIIGGISR